MNHKSKKADEPQIEEPVEESEEPGIDFDALDLEEPEAADEPQIEEPVEESEEPGIDFDALDLEEPEAVDEPQIQEPVKESEEPGIDFDAMALEDETEEWEEIELGLDDLQIDESGELELRTDSEAGETPTEDLLDLENIDMELDDLDEELK
jgi:hypothetical protein